MKPEVINNLIEINTEKSFGGLLGTEYINVAKLNYNLDTINY